MNLQNQSNVYLIIIPRNCTNDIHICGRCKVQYHLLSLFLKHKESCKENELKEFNSEVLAKKAEIHNLIELETLETFNETIDKNVNQINFINNNLVKDESHLQPCRIGNSEDQSNCFLQKNILSNAKNLVEQKSNIAVDWKRTLQNDEEDIAALLANQLSSETAADDLNGNMNVDVVCGAESADHQAAQARDGKEKDENKVMYRGKMRKLFKCQVDGCAYKTLLRKDIERHSRVHTGERPFKCFLCQKAFNRTDKLLLHQRIHAGDKRYKCTKCDYASVDSGSLIKHLRVHNGERPFKCQLCSYRARDSSQLTVHLRTHTGDSPFICTNSKCKAAFKTNSDLKRHMVVHSEQKPYSCAYCPYKSTLKHNLQIHVQSQHPNGELKEYRCHLCPRCVLPTPRKLKNHLRKHHGLAEDKAAKQTPSRNTRRGSGEGGEHDIEKQETFKRRRRKVRRNTGEKIAVGVMNKAYDCKQCDASFVCQDSLVTHERYHSKLEEEIRRAEQTAECSSDGKARQKKEVDDSEGRKVQEYGAAGLGLAERCPVNSSFDDSLRNAEILASLNTTQGGGIGFRQYVMIAPEAIQNVYNSEEYVLVQN